MRCVWWVKKEPKKVKLIYRKIQNRIAEKSKMNLPKNTKYACRGGWPRCMALTKDVIQKYNQKALASEKHPRDVYREPSALIVICANANMAYTTDSGVKIIPVGCLKD